MTLHIVPEQRRKKRLSTILSMIPALLMRMLFMQWMQWMQRMQRMQWMQFIQWMRCLGVQAPVSGEGTGTESGGSA